MQQPQPGFQRPPLETTWNGERYVLADDGMCVDDIEIYEHRPLVMEQVLARNGLNVRDLRSIDHEAAYYVKVADREAYDRVRQISAGKVVLEKDGGYLTVLSRIHQRGLESSFEAVKTGDPLPLSPPTEWVVPEEVDQMKELGRIARNIAAQTEIKIPEDATDYLAAYQVIVAGGSFFEAKEELQAMLHGLPRRERGFVYGPDLSEP